MKKIATLLLLVFFASSCKESNKNSEVENNAIEVLKKETTTKTKSKNNTTYLCEINGRKWSYTKASGIVSRHKKTKKRTAIITFTKQLEKSKESVQLHYDADSFELIIASLQLKFKNKEGKLSTCYYYLSPDTKKNSPKSTMSGDIDLSSPTEASGTAEVSNINIKYEKEELLDLKNAIVNLTDLKFSGVGYSDIDKFSKE